MISVLSHLKVCLEVFKYFAYVMNRKLEAVTCCKMVAFVLYMSPPGVYFTVVVVRLGNTLHMYLFASSLNLATDLSLFAAKAYCNNADCYVDEFAMQFNEGHYLFCFNRLLDLLL